MRSESTSGITPLPLQGHRPVALGFRKRGNSIKKVPRLAEPHLSRNRRGDRLRHLHHHRHRHRRTETPGQQVRIVACGTSWHAGLAGKFMIERLARLPVEVDYGSEFRYRDPILDAKTLTVCISQSGETADTIAAQREAKQKGSPTLAICNVLGSMITREAAGSILTHAGPEIGVASTKAFTAQLTALVLLAAYLGEVRGALSGNAAKTLLQEFITIPHKIETILQADRNGFYENLARHFFRCSDFLYLGRGIHYPIALEGALKLKEISYIHAEGYPAGEMKHGPNALIDE